MRSVPPGMRGVLPGIHLWVMLGIHLWVMLGIHLWVVLGMYRVVYAGYVQGGICWVCTPLGILHPTTPWVHPPPPTAGHGSIPPCTAESPCRANPGCYRNDSYWRTPYRRYCPELSTFLTFLVPLFPVLGLKHGLSHPGFTRSGAWGFSLSSMLFSPFWQESEGYRGYSLGSWEVWRGV